MEILEPQFLSRLQFAVTIMFHILFPTLTIGLGLYLVVVEALWLKRKDELYYRMYRFWAKIFGINFAVGVVSGVVMEFEFGTNWSRFSSVVANVFSPLLYFEVMTAFFLEAGFLYIMLFGWEKVSRGVHFLTTCLVAGGALLSAFWIMAGNSWMQTPAGFKFEGGKFVVTSFLAAIFNRSLPTSMAHMLLAALETSVFAVAGFSAYFLLKGKNVRFFRRSLGLALVMAAVFAPLQVYMGDEKGREVFHSQPAKLAAIESHWETNKEGGAPLILVGLPDMKNERTLFEVSIPSALSMLVTHSPNGRVPGLKEFPREDRPSAPVLFFSFRLMAGIGFVFLFVMCWAVVIWKRKRLFECRPFLRTLVVMQPLGWLATELGWVVTEAGRQPWLVYNVLRTADGVSPIRAGNIIWSLSLFFVIFVAIGSSYFYFIFKVMRNGPDLFSPIPPAHTPAGMQTLAGAAGSGRTEGA